MKNIIINVICFLIPLTWANSQITIKREGFGVATGRIDSGQWKLLTKQYAKIPVTGNNQLWDYSNLKDSVNSIYSNYFVPATNYGSLPNTFSDANLAYNSRIFFNIIAQYPCRVYQKLDSLGLNTLGITTGGAKFTLVQLTTVLEDSLYFLADTIRYSSNALTYKFPMTVGTSWKNNYTETINFKISLSVFGLNRTPGQRISYFSSEDSIAGWGTLRLKNPAGGANLEYAVLLHKHNDSRIDSFYLEGSPTSDNLLILGRLLQGTVTKSVTKYRFLGFGFKEPLLYLSVDEDRTISTTYRAVLPNLGLTVGNKEINNSFVHSTIFPNPANDYITINFDKKNSKDWILMIYNDIGQISSINTISFNQGIVNYPLKIDLPKGTYFYNLLDETSLIKSKGKFIVVK